MKIRYNVNGFGYTVTFEGHERVDKYKHVVLSGDYELDKFVMTLKADDDFTKTTDSDMVFYYDTITEAMGAIKAIMLWHNVKMHA